METFTHVMIYVFQSAVCEARRVSVCSGRFCFVLASGVYKVTCLSKLIYYDGEETLNTIRHARDAINSDNI